MEDYFSVPIVVKPKTILDISANIGAFALRSHQEWPKEKINCYEPIPSNVEILKANINPKWCQVEASGIKELGGEEEIYLGDMFVTGSFVKGGCQVDKKTSVQCVVAASLPSAELVKIDTEGSELEILKNLDLTKTKVIMLEHHSLKDAV